VAWSTPTSMEAKKNRSRLRLHMGMSRRNKPESADELIRRKKFAVAAARKNKAGSCLLVLLARLGFGCFTSGCKLRVL
jgi:hypothetical protein